MLKNPLILSGSIIVLSVAFIALFAPIISPYAPTELNLNAVLLAPSIEHWLGTDSLGRDTLSRLIYGARISLLVGFIAVGIATVIGLAIGALAGFYSKLDAPLMRLVDIMLCFPSFFLILAVIAFLKPSIVNIMIVIGLTSWMGIARLMRAEFLRLHNIEFIAAAQTQGVSDWRLMWRHFLPNSLAPVWVNTTLAIAAAILVESGLSFLGIGVQPPTPSWGNMLIEGKANIEVAWWLSVFPGLAILITVLGFNLLGEGLRDELDPRLKGKK
jgi:peptide/nickel transport system permease protein